MTRMIRIDDGWEFTPVFSQGFLDGTVQGENVRLPHTVKEMPLHYSDPQDYQMVSGYRRTFRVSDPAKRYFLRFDGAAHIATVYINGKETYTHRCGYTGFRFEITDLVRFDEDNTVTVKLDSTENPAVPPFGFVIDYLTYGGIYRHVWIEEHEKAMIRNVYITTPDLTTAVIDLYMDGDPSGQPALIRICDGEGNLMQETTVPAVNGKTSVAVPNARPWSPDHPVLYNCTISVGEETYACTFGFRTIELQEDKLLLNGEEVFLRGLNRHQCYPYAGYAVSDSLQVEDARILKEELGVNAVRTSHYPQSHAFIDACDRLGLLVFTEIPGWQHLGDRDWKKQALENTKDMVLEYRQHPSIILWGVRINESMDDDELYRMTNETAHRLDPTRPTSGVRYLEKSSLLEDVYAYNDFSHTGNNSGTKAKKDVTPDMSKPMLVSEANGHMFPTKSFDTWQRRQSHALRHARVLNDAVADGEHIGCFQWCMFDYATHKDFGSGDRICYHGVMDSFRNPKLAAAVYASQQDDMAVLEISSPMDIGDYPAGNLGEIYAFTNADEVRLYKNDDFVASFTSEGWSGLKHGPVKIDDTIGCLLETKEGFTGTKARLIHDALAAAGKYGMAGLPLQYKLMLARCMIQYHMKYEDGVALYGKYVGGWGGDSTEWKFEAVKDGKVVKTVIRSPHTALHLDVQASSLQLRESDTYDMCALRMQIRDDLGNLASYAQLPVEIDVQGPAEIVGPHVCTAEGGMCGTYIRTAGEAGEIIVSLKAQGLAEKKIVLQAVKG